MSQHTHADQELLQFATELAQEAGAMTLDAVVFDVETKADSTPVTDVDRRVERFLREQLSRAFPQDGVLGEEEPETIGTSGRRWILDPIDGTKAFVRGVPLYANLLALQDGEDIRLGVINLPALGETVSAARGLGCWLNGERCRVSDAVSLEEAWITTTSTSDWPVQALDEVTKAGAHLRTWGDAYGYALVATGRAEAMVDIYAQPYDLAPMPVIISEAGGRFTTIGGSTRFDGGSGVATNGRVHEEVRRLLALPDTRDAALEPR